MARIEGPKWLGPYVIDLTPNQDDLVDLAPNARKGARAAQEGVDAVLDELQKSMPNYGDDAEIHPSVYKRVVADTERIARLRARKIELSKAMEVVDESLGQAENNREDDLSTIGTAAEKLADKAGKTDLAAHFSLTIKYKSQIADRAAETRKKNEEAKAAAKASAAGSAGGTGTTGGGAPGG
jgi:hypothetical protein